ncbi:MAG: sterol desaturase family protein [Rhodanobacter sp.]
MALRLSLFLTLLLLLAAAEWVWPRHHAAPQRRRRWTTNLGFGVMNALGMRVLGPWAAVSAAAWAQLHGVGILHVTHAPTILAALIGLLALDLVIYLQHRLMHRVDWLWRLHRMHHTDLAIDVSSGVRFHPLEIVFSMGVKVGAVLLLGVTPGVVMVFEIVLSSFSLFTHANVAIPPRIDRWLRWVIVTPDMHRIHHSVLRDEHDSNYGFQLIWWDRLFNSYRANPRQPQATIKLGLDRFRSDEEQHFTQLLWQPSKPLG